MSDWLFIPVALLYFLVSGLLFFFGLNFIYLSVLTWRRGSLPEKTPQALKDWPRVTVQLPIYNELYVAERVIEAATQLEYPADRLQIQVLDDSTDETTTLIGRAIARGRGRGIEIEHRHRRDRTGFKAGALQAGMESATGEFIAIFDADFVPEPDFLLRTLPYLKAPDLAFVQTRWGHTNQDYSWLTKLQSLAIDAHFMVEQFARSQTGYWFNFNGTAGIWRRAAMEDAGGWQADTLTEDLDLSYRAFLRGWKARYARDIVTPAELPVDFRGFRRQQHRWARGSLECALKLLPSVWRAPIARHQKIQALLHLTGYSVHVLLFLLMLVYPLVVQLSVHYPGFSQLFGFALVFSLTALAPTLFFVFGQQQLGRPWMRLLPKILALTVLGSGMMLNTVRAAGRIVIRRPENFERTAKFGVGRQSRDWTRKRYQLRFDPVAIAEIVFGCFSLATAGLAWRSGTWGIAMYAFLFGAGLLLVAGMTIVQSFMVFRSRKARKIRTAAERARLGAG